MFKLDSIPKDFDEYRFLMMKAFQASPIAQAIWNDPEIIATHSLMESAHEGAIRKFNKLPYATHPRRVAMFMCLHEMASICQTKAGLTHDILEDVPEYDYEGLAYKIGRPAADIVVEVTNVKHSIRDQDQIIRALENMKNVAVAASKWELALEYRQRLDEAKNALARNNPYGRDDKKLLDRNRLLAVSHQAKILKLFDRLDNIFEVEPSSDFAKKYAKETILLLDVIGKADLYLSEIIEKRCQQLLTESTK